MLFCLFSFVSLSILVCSGCYNKITYTGGLSKIFISHSSGSWKSRSSYQVFSSFLACKWPPSHWIFIWCGEEVSILFLFVCFNFFFKVYLFLGQRETEHERGRGRERGRHRIGNRLQALSHQPGARRGAGTHGPRDRDLSEVRRPTDCATQAPQVSPFICNIELKLVMWPAIDI